MYKIKIVSISLFFSLGQAFWMIYKNRIDQFVLSFSPLDFFGQTLSNWNLGEASTRVISIFTLWSF